MGATLRLRKCRRNWVWWLFKLWTCHGCGARFRRGRAHWPTAKRLRYYQGGGIDNLIFRDERPNLQDHELEGCGSTTR